MRTIAQAVSPSLGGWVMATFSSAMPFVFGGGIKILYDVGIYRLAKKSGHFV